jgi:hypothetical protein
MMIGRRSSSARARTLCAEVPLAFLAAVARSLSEGNRPKEEGLYARTWAPTPRTEATVAVSTEGTRRNMVPGEREEVLQHRRSSPPRELRDDSPATVVRSSRCAVEREADMDLFTVVERWFWAFCIAVSFINAAIFRVRAQRRIRENPALAEGYARLLRGFLLWGNLPWIVMGIGCVVGRVPSIQSFFQPRSGNPFVLAFFGSVFLLWGLGTFWLLFRGGAEMLVKHPGMFNVDFKNPRTLKVWWFLCLAWGVFAVVMMFVVDPYGSPHSLVSESTRGSAITQEGTAGYRVVFDIASAGYRSWPIPAFGLIFVSIGAGLIVFKKSLPQWKKAPLLFMAFSIFFLGFAILWTAVVFVSTYSEYSSLVSAEQEGRVEVVEGVVTNFAPMPTSGRGWEQFCVSGRCFDYSDSSISTAFNNTSLHGGPIRAGLPVRVSYVGNSIAKLEVATGDSR